MVSTANFDEFRSSICAIWPKSSIFKSVRVEAKLLRYGRYKMGSIYWPQRPLRNTMLKIPKIENLENCQHKYLEKIFFFRKYLVLKVSSKSYIIVFYTIQLFNVLQLFITLHFKCKKFRNIRQWALC